MTRPSGNGPFWALLFGATMAGIVFLAVIAWAVVKITEWITGGMP